ncbi:hypothetical protein F2P81_022204 [Scophthalmus maximus]|uniref:Uncharacterized protein n=1 Tax=Scophthalmus maximus TaxID=52904 RepID=A0A6A4RTI5_SCOMX|nr:hypothetical protein F2P81_022204 [Scophthalmus maximus]
MEQPNENTSQPPQNGEEVSCGTLSFKGALALNSGDHCQMGKRQHRQKERPESIRKWQLFSCARGAGQLPGLVAKLTGSSASWCSGQQLDLMEEDGSG